MIEICKTLTINIFWVLAAVIEVIMLTLLVIGIINTVLERLLDNNKEGKE